MRNDPLRPIPKPRRIQSESRKAWVRRQPCICIGVTHLCKGAVEASHVRAEGHGGMGTKPSDFDTLPKCHIAHMEFHALGRAAFEKAYGFNCAKLIREHNARYWKEHPKAKILRKPRLKSATLKIVGICKKNHVTKIPIKKFNDEKFWCVQCRAYCDLSNLREVAG